MSQYKSCMSRSTRLDDGQREFFELVARIAFCNPFSTQRAELDAKLFGRAVDIFADKHPEALNRALSQHIERLEKVGLADVRKHSGRDHALMRTVFLFECYHLYCDRID